MSEQASPFEFGRLVGHLEAIQRELKELKDRTIWRLDDIERRVETLEKYKEVDEKPRLADKMADKIVWALLAAAGMALLSMAIGG